MDFLAQKREKNLKSAFSKVLWKEEHYGKSGRRLENGKKAVKIKNTSAWQCQGMYFHE